MFRVDTLFHYTQRADDLLRQAMPSFDDEVLCYYEFLSDLIVASSEETLPLPLR